MPDPIQHQGLVREMRAFWDQQVAEKARKKEEAVLKKKRGIPLFNLILEGIKEVYEIDGVIAGGAVRDVVAGHTLHKDVDLFLPISWDKFAERVQELGWKAVEPMPVPPGYAKKGVVSRANAAVQHLVTDIIFQEKPFTVDDLSSFPIYAQRAMYTLDRGLFVAKECQKDVNDKTFTIDPTITNKDVVKNLRAKVRSWQERIPYADWKVVEPETQEWWEATEELKEEATVTKASSWDSFTRQDEVKVVLDALDFRDPFELPGWARAVRINNE